MGNHKKKRNEQRHGLNICPRCFNLDKLTRHHIYPQSKYGKNMFILYICRKCHDQLHRELKDKFTSMNKSQLIAYNKAFTREEKDYVRDM